MGGAWPYLKGALTGAWAICCYCYCMPGVHALWFLHDSPTSSWVKLLSSRFSEKTCLGKQGGTWLRTSDVNFQPPHVHVRQYSFLACFVFSCSTWKLIGPELFSMHKDTHARACIRAQISMDLEVLLVPDRKKMAVLGVHSYSFFLCSTFIVYAHVLTFLNQYLGV